MKKRILIIDFIVFLSIFAIAKVHLNQEAKEIGKQNPASGIEIKK